MLPEPKKRLTAGYLLYAFTIFLSAFLLFAIQPMVSKFLLPFFGGSSSVWATSMLFFTGMLFTGYAYVLLLSTRTCKHQAIIHGTLTIACVVLVISNILRWHSFFPSFDWIVDSSRLPGLNVLVALLIVIGAPYFLLATTGPLLQLWWGTSSQKEPYKLYALSNIGSLLALLSYPFLIEPYFALRAQQAWWDLIFIAYATFLIIVAVRYARAPTIPATNNIKEKISVRVPTICLWIGLGALPAFLLVATTTFITQVIAPVPLLWVIPLALYLLTFIFAFAGYGRSTFIPILLLASTIFAYHNLITAPARVFVQILAYLLLLFLCGLLCHGLLYARRPDIQKLPLFYLFLSLGGMVGTLAASFAAPLLFSDFYEFTLALALSAIVAIVSLPSGFFPRMFHAKWILLMRVALVCGVVALTIHAFLRNDGVPTLRSRNFYGAVRVRFLETVTELMHGKTLHGLQSKNQKLDAAPTAYYVRTSGIGRSMIFENRIRDTSGLRVGILGLGVGTISAYCRPGDTFVFYEIDPRIESIARQHFSYLTRCTGSEVRLGDGRLRMQEEAAAGDFGSYDVIAIDAFSDDTIPIHLVTQQAIELYAKHLRGPQSIIAIHASNRYVYLPPVILRIARELGMSASIVADGGEGIPLSYGSVWVLLSPSPEVFTSREFAHTKPQVPQDTPLWTDDYASLWSVVEIPWPWK